MMSIADSEGDSILILVSSCLVFWMLQFLVLTDLVAIGEHMWAQETWYVKTYQKLDFNKTQLFDGDHLVNVHK